MRALTYALHLLEPLLVGGLDNREENSARSLDYVPGSVIRGALCTRYIRAHQNEGMNDPACRRLFFDGHARFLNAYPVSRTGRRSLPTPLSLRANKSELQAWKSETTKPLRVSNTVASDEWAEDEQPFGPGYCDLHGSELEPVDVQRISITHNARGHQRTLDAKKDTQVFNYEALNPGQRFCGVVLGPDDVLGAIQDLLNHGQDIAMGGSRNAGYGRVRIENVSINTQWSEADSDTEKRDRVLITLLSDAILLDPLGQFALDPGESLGLAPALRQNSKRGLTGGFNRTWALPLPQAQTVQKGSVYVFGLPDGYDRAILAKAANEGIGLRREDGFGRITVDWASDESLTASTVTEQSVREETPALSGAALDLANRIVENVWRTRLDQALQEAVATITPRGTASASALSRMRLAAREAATKRGLDPVIALLESMKDPKTGKLKAGGVALEKVKIGRLNLREWTLERCKLLDIDVQLKAPRPEALGDAKAGWTDALKAEYMARLVEGVVQRKIKSDKRRQEERG